MVQCPLVVKPFFEEDDAAVGIQPNYKENLISAGCNIHTHLSSHQYLTFWVIVNKVTENLKAMRQFARKYAMALGYSVHAIRHILDIG